MSKRVLITGGAGFIGSHLARELADRGYQVRVLDNFAFQVHGQAPGKREERARKIAEGSSSIIEIVEGDVRSRDDVVAALRGVDVVYHFAAAVGVGQSMYQIRSYVDNNNLGTACLLQALLDRPVERLIVASSMSLYGEGLYQDESGAVHSGIRRELSQLRRKNWEPLGESGQALKPIPTPESKKPDLASIYALSKFDQERMCLLIGQAYQIPTVALRFFNVYGRGQALSNPYTGVMAIFSSRLLNDSAPLLFEDGNQLRDFVHVSDVVQACRLAMEVEEAAGNAFNVGSGQRHSVREVAEKIARVLGKDGILPEITGQYRVGDIRHCFADISLARERLGYAPRMTLSDGIRDLAEWLAGQKAVDHTHRMREELSAKGLAL